MAFKLGLIEESPVNSGDHQYSRELVKRWLVDPVKNPRDKNIATAERASWLLVFDSVDDTSVLNGFWPYNGPGSILITSRNPFSWTTSLPLLPFNDAEASEYLLRLTGRDRHSESDMAIQEAGRKLGGLPLALTQMAGIIARQDMTFTNFTQAFNERERRTQMLQTAPMPSLKTPWYRHSVASVWALETLEHGLALLNTCSMFDPDGIAEHIFVNNLGKVHLTGLPNNLGEYERAKAELLGSSIISSGKSSSKIFVHRLVQEVARMRMSTTEFKQTFSACLQLIGNLWPFEDFSWRHDIGRWPVCEKLFPHVRRLRDIANQYQHPPWTDDFEGGFAFARLLTDAGYYHLERGGSDDVLLFNSIAEKICYFWLDQLSVSNIEGHMSPDDRVQRIRATLSEITHNRGNVVLTTNQPHEALTYLKEFNEQMIKEFDHRPELVQKDMRLAISWNELGNAYMQSRDWKKGEECFERSLETIRLRAEFDIGHVSLPTVNLGLTYWLQNRLHEAVNILEEGLEARQKEYGMDDRVSFVTGRFYHALGNVMKDLNQHDQSLDYHRRALVHYKATLGNGHHRTADLFYKVAEHSLRMNQDDNALALLDHALEVYGYRDTGDRAVYIPEKARAIFKRSQLLRRMGQVEEADQNLMEAVELLEQVRGPLKGSKPEDLTDHDFDEIVTFWSK